jgi:hypothetical protein
MDEKHTLQLILQYVYGETDPTQDLKVRGILENQPQMQRYYSEILEVKNQLNSIAESPNPTSVAIISEHSHDSHTEAV